MGALEPGATPLLVVGAGHMGGALIAGWLRTGALAAGELIVRDPHPGEAALEAARAGARLNLPDADLADAKSVVLAVKPQAWRATAEAVAPSLSPDAVIVSVVAGVETAALAGAFAGRTVARVMPTIAAALGAGAASVFAADARARRRAHVLFEPLGAVVDLEDEGLLHVATAASGSAPAYVFALIEALEAAGADAGLPAGAARALARSTLTGAAALLEASGEDAASLRRKVTSPGGTTEAALGVLGAGGALTDLVRRAVFAAMARSRALGAGA